ncbi:CMD domain protein, partial [Bradyrhizobium sp. 24]|nr:CMD domain protein [Bradyrhizobium sp. 24]
MATKDIIDTLARIEPGSALDGIRAKRVQARDNAQKSYLSLFEPLDAGDVSLVERAAVAFFVIGLH